VVVDSGAQPVMSEIVGLLDCWIVGVRYVAAFMTKSDI
jgi:hypothetical protein